MVRLFTVIPSSALFSHESADTLRTKLALFFISVKSRHTPLACVLPLGFDELPPCDALAFDP